MRHAWRCIVTYEHAQCFWNQCRCPFHAIQHVYFFLATSGRLQVDYYLALGANKFTGNSVSTFTAFLILERQWLGRWAGVQGLCFHFLVVQVTGWHVLVILDAIFVIAVAITAMHCTLFGNVVRESVLAAC
jgi:hypothetical protein